MCKNVGVTVTACIFKLCYHYKDRNLVSLECTYALFVTQPLSEIELDRFELIRILLNLRSNWLSHASVKQLINVRPSDLTGVHKKFKLIKSKSALMQVIICHLGAPLLSSC